MSLQRSHFNYIFKFWWITLFIKLIISAIIPLSQDETYYWVWSQQPQLSYFDHPAMVSWLLWLGHIFEFLGHAVRWPAVLLGHLTLLIWIFLLKDLKFDVDRITVWLWLALSSPLIGVGSLIITPDLPVVFFWSLSMLLLHKALTKNNNIFYILLGLSLGLGFCSKYHIVLFVPAVFIYLFLSSQNKIINKTGVILTVCTGLAFSLPVLIWNYQNDFSSFKFQINHGLGEKVWDPLWTISYLIGQFVLLFPTSIWAAAKSYKNYFLSVFAFFPLLFFFGSSFKGVVEVNWPIIAFPAFLALAAEANISKKIIHISTFFWGSLSLFIVGISIFGLQLNVPEKLTENRYFEKILPLATEYKPLYLGSYQMASTFWYHYKTPYNKLYQINRHDLFDEKTPHPPQENEYFLIKENWVNLPEWLTPDKFSVILVKELPPKFDLYKVTKK